MIVFHLPNMPFIYLNVCMYVFQVLTVKQSFRLLLRTDMEEPLFLIVNYLKFFSFRSFVLQVFMEKHQSRDILKSSCSLGC